MRRCRYLTMNEKEKENKVEDNEVKENSEKVMEIIKD